MDWYEYVCPVHGVIIRHRRTERDPPTIPLTCPNDVPGRVRCGERLRFRFLTSTSHSTSPIGPLDT